MPPSGYSKSQLSGIDTFFQLCAKALEVESVDNNETYIQALQRECADIMGELNIINDDNAQEGILKITHEFYNQVLSLKPNNKSKFWDAVSLSSHKLQKKILEIHIPPGKYFSSQNKAV